MRIEVKRVNMAAEPNVRARDEMMYRLGRRPGTRVYAITHTVPVTPTTAAFDKLSDPYPFIYGRPTDPEGTTLAQDLGARYGSISKRCAKLYLTHPLTGVAVKCAGHTDRYDRDPDYARECQARTDNLNRPDPLPRLFPPRWFWTHGGRVIWVTDS